LHKHLATAKQQQKQQADLIHDLRSHKGQLEEDKEQLVLQIKSVQANHLAQIEKNNEKTELNNASRTTRHLQDLEQMKQEFEEKIKNLEKKN